MGWNVDPITFPRRSPKRQNFDRQQTIVRPVTPVVDKPFLSYSSFFAIPKRASLTWPINIVACRWGMRWDMVMALRDRYQATPNPMIDFTYS
jgi:hypothetical protein